MEGGVREGVKRGVNKWYSMRGVEGGVRGAGGSVREGVKRGVSALLLPDGVPAPLSRACSTSSHRPSNPLTSD